VFLPLFGWLLPFRAFQPVPALSGFSAGSCPFGLFSRFLPFRAFQPVPALSGFSAGICPFGLSTGVTKPNGVSKGTPFMEMRVIFLKKRVG
jgi:hypothetical protein